MMKYWILGMVLMALAYGLPVYSTQNNDVQNIVNLIKAGSKSALRVNPLHPHGQFQLSKEEADDIDQMTHLENTISDVEQAYHDASESCVLSTQPKVGTVSAKQDSQDSQNLSNDELQTGILFLAKLPKLPSVPESYATSVLTLWDESSEETVIRHEAYYNDLHAAYPQIDQVTGREFLNLLIKFDEETKRQLVEDGKIPVYMNRQEVVYSIKDHLIENPTEKTFHETMGRFKDKLSFDEKLSLAANLGNAFEGRYSYERYAGQPTKWGEVVDVSELLQSVKNKEPGGVCRDIAAAQAKTLSELGVKNTYVIGYTVPGNLHASVVTQDPNDKNRIYKIDYGAIAADRPSLELPAPDRKSIGLGFRIYDPDGRPVAKLPSDFGNILSRVTSMDANSKDPFLRNQTHLNQVEIAHTESGLSGRIFSGQTSIGDSVVGISSIRPFSRGHGRLKGSFGTSISHFETPTRKDDIPLSGNHLVARLQSALFTPEVSRNGFYIRGSGALDLAAAHVITKFADEDDTEKITTGEMSTSVGISGGFGQPGSKTTAQFDVQSEFYPDFEQVQGAKLPTAKGKSIFSSFFHNATILKNRIQHIHNPDLVTVIDSAVALRNVGNNYSFRVGLLRPQSGQQYSVGVEAPSTDDMPRFFPGSVPKCTASAQGMLCGFDVSLSYETTLESDRQEQMNINLQKKF